MKLVRELCAMHNIGMSAAAPEGVPPGQASIREREGAHMDLKDYFGILWRRKWIVVASIVAALAIAIAGTAAIRPAYQATATVRVAASATGLLNYTVLTYSEHLINTAAQIVSSQPMLDQVMSRLKLTEKPVITAALMPGTELIKITVE